MLIEINEVYKPKLKSPIIIEGFPGIGMVGTISASYLSEKLGMKLAAYISSSHFPPIAAIHDYRPVSPARIYASEKLNLIVLFSEFIIPADIVYLLSKKIMAYAEEKKAKAIYSLAGMASQKPSAKIFGIASTTQMADRLRGSGVELVKEGATQGVSGLLISECANKGFPAANLLIQTDAPMDPKGSAKLLSKLSEIIEVPIDVSTLLREADSVEQKIKESIDKIKTMNTKYSEMAENPMYG